ncbi:ADP-ribose glycohydrolase MACROD1 isoform X2 [Brachyhypopomus gauderio]|uniref:ADP-ribose glycohydrolase MACROD1 isoform X2 n=1 Tax=Brachyhypopomus gauderio TaxID=698409 RepID=UPI0040423301
MAFQVSKLTARFSYIKNFGLSLFRDNKFARSQKRTTFTQYRPGRSSHAVGRSGEGSVNTTTLNSPPSSERVINTVRRAETFSTTSKSLASPRHRAVREVGTSARPRHRAVREGGTFWRPAAGALGALGLAAGVVVASVHSSALCAMASRTLFSLDSDKTDWKEAKKLLLSMSVQERRGMYRTDHIPLDQIPVWKPQGAAAVEPIFKPNEELNQKISLFRGDITKLEIDAIANAANKTLLGGGGVDGAIHRGAGPLLKKECSTLGGCETGEAKITSAYGLPAKYVIHTVGPIAHGSVGERERKALRECYYNCLLTATDNQLRTVAFPCISTGVYGYPPEQAVEVALTTVREYLEKHHAQMDRVIFCVFLQADEELYRSRLSAYFPQAC